MKVLSLAIAVALLLCSCSDAGPGSTDPTATSEVPQHLVEPTEEMKDAAEKQCREDPDLDEGYVQAVDPNTGQKLIEYSVDCSTVGG